MAAPRESHQADRRTRDPVCGEKLSAHDAVASMEHAGRTFYFAHIKCKMLFERDPRSYWDPGANPNDGPETPEAGDGPQAIALPHTPPGAEGDNSDHDPAQPTTGHSSEPADAAPRGRAPAPSRVVALLAALGVAGAATVWLWREAAAPDPTAVPPIETTQLPDAANAHGDDAASDGARAAGAVDEIPAPAATPVGGSGERHGEAPAADATAAPALADRPPPPEAARARYQAGLAHLGSGRLASAVTELRAAVALAPRYPQPHLALGVAYRRQDRAKLAVAELVTYLSLAPEAADDQEVRQLLAATSRAAAARGTPPPAPNPEVAARTTPAEQYALGNRYLAEGNLAAALAAYRLCVQLNPRYAEAHAALASVYKRQGRNRMAADALMTYVRLAGASSNPERMAELLGGVDTSDAKSK